MMLSMHNVAKWTFSDQQEAVWQHVVEGDGVKLVVTSCLLRKDEYKNIWNLIQVVRLRYICRLCDSTRTSTRLQYYRSQGSNRWLRGRLINNHWWSLRIRSEGLAEVTTQTSSKSQQRVMGTCVSSTLIGWFCRETDYQRRLHPIHLEWTWTRAALIRADVWQKGSQRRKRLYLCLVIQMSSQL